MEIDICGYKELGIPCGQSNFCNGYNNNCAMYTTYGHIIEFEEMFGIRQNEDLRDLEKKIKLFEKDLNENN